MTCTKEGFSLGSRIGDKYEFIASMLAAARY